MLKRLAVFVCCVGFILMPALGETTNFVTVGTRPTGMGGAGVADPEGAYSIYWNPAKFEKEASWNFIFPTVGYHAEQHNHLLRKLDDILEILGEYDLGDEEINNDHIAVQRIREIIYELDREGTGIVSDAHAGMLFKMRQWMFGYLAIAYGGIPLDIDTEHLSVGDEDNPDSISNNRTAIDSWGLITHQFIAGYVLPIYEDVSINDRLHDFSFGFTLKYIYGLSYSYYASVYDKDVDDRDKDNPWRENERRRSTISYDLGFHYTFDDNLQVGLVFRDCTSPLFPRASRDDTPDRSIRLPIQSRLGVCYNFNPSFSAALDIDLTDNNSSTLDGYKDRRLGLGLEKNFFNEHLTTRLGYYQNIAENASDSVITVGLGFRIGLFHMEAGFGITPSNYGSEHVLFIDETVGSFHLSFYNHESTTSSSSLK